MTGPLEKLRRAGVHFHDLDRKVIEFRRNNKYEIVVAELEPCGEYHALRAVVPRGPPTEWGTIIGDIAHNLRSALDALMWQLIILNELDPASLKRPLPAFPVFREHKTPTGSGWWNEGRRHVARVLPEHARWIEKLQPYHTGNPDGSALWALHELNNSDKHKIIQVVGVAQCPVIGFLGTTDQALIRLMAKNVEFCPEPLFLVDGAKLGKVHRCVLAKCDPKYMPTFEIAFESGCRILKGHGVIPVLATIWDQVSHILRGFRNVFRNPFPNELADGLTIRIVHGEPPPSGSKTVVIEGTVIPLDDGDDDADAGETSTDMG